MYSSSVVTSMWCVIFPLPTQFVLGFHSTFTRGPLAQSLYVKVLLFSGCIGCTPTFGMWVVQHMFQDKFNEKKGFPQFEIVWVLWRYAHRCSTHGRCLFLMDTREWIQWSTDIRTMLMVPAEPSGAFTPVWLFGFGPWKRMIYCCLCLWSSPHCCTREVTWTER